MCVSSIVCLWYFIVRGADFVTPVLNFCVTVPTQALQKLVRITTVYFKTKLGLIIQL